jgi:hypothetical protein
MDGDGVIRSDGERPTQDNEDLTSLTGDLANNLATVLRTGVAVGRCLEDHCPTVRVKMTFREERHVDWIPVGDSQFCCPTCGERLRVDRMDVRTVTHEDVGA